MYNTERVLTEGLDQIEVMVDGGETPALQVIVLVSYLCTLIGLSRIRQGDGYRHDGRIDVETRNCT